ncbi:hypothetical protein A2974_02165 [Candidatus Peregrinibacteria bacterium RIFCSPLOWO2_01_FULL_48_20]|nr:MAG: hypothetical protein A2974_02165 [Candidatus Peregrinibacteria bacterium RIFCSPLOWO2_01_FULL_48_20]
MAIDFESIHKNFNGVMLGLCTACGGSCEKNQITLFLPGEIEFVAGKLGMDLMAFKEKFCNTIVFKGQHIFIMKAGVCPFLNASYHCELEDSNCKLTRCLLYPVIVSLVNGKAAVYLDEKGCPMTRWVPKEFTAQATEIYEEIKNELPDWWLEFVVKYDEALYDYSKLTRHREKRFIELRELESCMIKEWKPAPRPTPNFVQIGGTVHSC